jgi:hypothetical protein
MIQNFATASMSREDINERLAAVQEDALRLLTEGGVSRFGAELAWRGEAAALVREAVQDVFKMTDPTPIFTERREGKMGDTYEFEQLINTLRVVEYSPASEPQIFTPRKAKYTIKTGSHEMAFGIPLQKIITGQHTIGEFADMAAQALTRHYVRLSLTAVNAACSSGATDLKGRNLRTSATGSSVAQTEIDGALRRILAYNAGVTIYGSRYALDPIMGFAASNGGDATKEELMRRGVVGTYRGAKLVELVDDYNVFYQSYSTVAGIDYDKLIFISSAVPGATLLEKDLSALNWEELDAKKAMWSTGVRFEHGILVHSPYRYHVIQLA